MEDLKRGRGYCGNDNGWIEECAFFSTDAEIDSIPLHAGDKDLAFVEEDPLLYESKVCVSSEEGVSKNADSKVKDLSVCVSQVKKNFIYIGNEYYFYLDSISKAILGFTPCEGDWLDIEYSVEQGSPKITVHSVKATQRRQLEEVCVTSIHKKKGMLNHTIFFTLDSLNLPLGYSPILGHMVNVVIIQSTQQNCKWRAISMTPISRTVVGIGPGNSSSLLFLYQ
uniref:Uncharacterized protein n=1 Tax=Mus spicilegus TaxID=10103 RepID=A0A8C6MQQ9_MUSSI